MAKKQTPNGKSRVRVIAFEFEGADDTIKEGFHSIAAAINKTFQPPTQTIVQRVTGSSQSLENATETAVIEPVDLDLEEEFVSEPSKSQSSKPRNPPKMKVVEDLNLHPAEKESFTDFHRRHQHSTQREQLLLAVYYLEVVLESEEITPQHVYTCFEEVGASSPNDLPQAMRNLCSRKQWIKKNGKNKFAMTMPGINHVKQKLVQDSKDVEE